MIEGVLETKVSRTKPFTIEYFYYKEKKLPWNPKTLPFIEYIPELLSRSTSQTETKGVLCGITVCGRRNQTRLRF